MSAYTITVHRLTGEDNEIESVRECYCDTYWNAIEIFDWLIRGIPGHYRAWMVDNVKNECVHQSEVCYN